MSDNDLIRRGDALKSVNAIFNGYPNQPADAIAALPAATVGVKPLVWFEAELPSRGGGKYTSDGYTIRRIEGLWLLDFAGNGKTAWRWVDLDAAKAAAQADYEARILAALEPQPAPDAYCWPCHYAGSCAKHPPAPAEDAKAKGETDGQMLERLGMDGAKWAAEFRTTALRLGYSDMDEGWLIGWFANAIMAGYDRKPAPDAHVNETPKTEHDAGNVLTPAPDAALSAERETVARLTEALADMIAVADQDEWHKATTGRQIVITNARAALTQKEQPDG